MSAMWTGSRSEKAKRRKKAENRRYNSPAHRALRKELDPLVQAGLIDCVRCGEPIEPGAWDLGHDDLYPHLHAGPEHTWCNRGAPNRNITSQQW